MYTVCPQNPYKLIIKPINNAVSINHTKKLIVLDTLGTPLAFNTNNM